MPSWASSWDWYVSKLPLSPEDLTLISFSIYSQLKIQHGGQHQKTAAGPGDEADAPGEHGYRLTHRQITEQL